MHTEWNRIYLTDKSGNQYFRTTASPMGTLSEIRNIERKIAHCGFIDHPTAQIILNGEPYKQPEITDDELMAELLSPEKST